MKTSKIFLFLGVVAFLSLIMASGNALAAPGQTGQGIMVNLVTQGALAIVDNKTYTFDNGFDDETGIDGVTVHGTGTYYNNAWDGNTPTSSTHTTGGSFCTPSTPSCPGAPAADNNEVIGPSGVAFGDRCTFLDGGVLSSSSYTQNATNSSSCTSGIHTVTTTITCTYTYNITPNVTPVDPFTSWYLTKESNPNGTTTVNIDAYIAGESVVKNATVGQKYSFSLVDSTDSNRVQNLALYVDSNLVANPGSTIVTNTPGSTANPTGSPSCSVGDVTLDSTDGSVDFCYTTNAGSNGTTSLLSDGGHLGDPLYAEDARYILNNDPFAGNNDGGADGSALAIAVMDTVPIDLGARDHIIMLTGTVKGNSGSGSISFNVGQHINIITPGCGQ